MKKEMNGGTTSTANHEVSVQKFSSQQPEPEHRGSVWTHPYVLYIILTAFLFGFLLIMGWVAWNNGWIPKRR